MFGSRIRVRVYCNVAYLEARAGASLRRLDSRNVQGGDK